MEVEPVPPRAKGSTLVRSVAAVLLGYVAMSALTAVLLALIARHFPYVFPEVDSFPTAPWVVLLLAADFLFAGAGGFVTASIADSEEEKHVVALAIFVLVLGIASVATMPDSQPVWYKVVLILLGLAGVRIGGNIAILRKSRTAA